MASITDKLLVVDAHGHVARCDETNDACIPFLAPSLFTLKDMSSNAKKMTQNLGSGERM
jgi:hypothetical protein